MRPRCGASARTSASCRIVMGATIMLYVLSLLLSRRAQHRMMLAQRARRLYLLGASGAVPVFELGWWWTVITAGWLHGGLAAHVLQRDVDPPARTRDRRISTAPGRMVIIYTVSSVAGFALEQRAGVSCRSSPFVRRRSSRSARRPRSSASSARSCITGGAAAAATSASRAAVRALPRRSWVSSCPGVDNAAHLGRICRRVSRVDDHRSAQARTHRSHRRRGGMPGR